MVVRIRHGGFLTITPQLPTTINNNLPLNLLAIDIFIHSCGIHVKILSLVSKTGVRKIAKSGRKYYITVGSSIFDPIP